jgi:RNA polymerase sigma-70 factor (ECF subfamily)
LAGLVSHEAWLFPGGGKTKVPMKISGPAWREATLVDCVAAAGAGDQRAFAELFERYRQYAWGVARSVTRSHQAAEEATVDGFAAAFRSIDRLRDPARFPSYLAACVRNEALQEVRRRTPTADSGEFEDVELDSLAEPDTPETRLVSSEEGRRALEAFRRLDDRQREAILLVDVEGVEPSEVAATFGITVNALHQLLHRSREALRHRYVAPAISEASPSACLTCNDKLGVYLAGRASVRVISMVDDHTSTCPDCQARLADARETNDCVRAAYGVAPDGCEGRKPWRPASSAASPTGATP